MSENSKRNTSSETDFLQLKDKIKYYLNIKNLSKASAEAQLVANPISNETIVNPKIIKSESSIKSFLKKVKKSTPDFLIYNPATGILFRLIGKIIDAKEKKIRRGIKTNLILFENGIPDFFEMPLSETLPLVTIIIPVHNKFDFTHRCLFSIKEHSKEIGYEVIIADDASSDQTLTIADVIRNVRVCRNEKSLGFLENCNAAAQNANGKFILFLNNDTVVQPHWLSSLLVVIENDDQVGMTGSKLVYPDGLLQEAGGIIWSDGSGWNYGKNHQPNAPEYNYVKEVDFISGASLMIKTSLWKEIGGFDKQFAPAYYEDTDLAFEVRKRGYKVVYQPKSVVVHFEGVSHGTDTNSGIKSYQVVNKEKFVAKWSIELLSAQFKNESEIFLARDRSKQKKTMLFIDHYVPEPDKDAGSKSSLQYLKLFLEMGFNVKFIGDSFINTVPYTSNLEQLGVEVLYGYHYQQNWKEWMSINRNEIQYVFLNRPHTSSKYIDFIKENLTAKIIYFGHDLHYLREERQYKIDHNKHLLESAKRWKKVEFDIFSKSNLVLFPSIKEVEEILKTDHKINAAVIPLNIFEKNTGSSAKEFLEEKKDLLFVGGFNHLPNVDAVLWFCKEILPEICKENNKIKLIIVGSNVSEEITQLASKNIIIKGYVSEEELVNLYLNCKIVIAPLRFGAGVKGKIIEAIYYRCAVVTTSIGVEGLDNSMGIITVADDSLNIAKSILSLYNNNEKLKQIFNDSPEFIDNYFSKEKAIAFVKKYIF